MKERPILFSGAMVRAILDDRKTQTRRVIKLQPPTDYDCPDCWRHHKGARWHAPRRLRGGRWQVYDGFGASTHHFNLPDCPYGEVGDRLWVRETWQPWAEEITSIDNAGDCLFGWHYAADGAEVQDPQARAYVDASREERWRPSIHMPRAASRIQLEVVEVRVERLHDITEDEAIAEGLERREPRDGQWCEWRGADDAGGRPRWYESPIPAFRALWDSINEKRGHGWNTNPWVWVVKFQRVDGGEA